jgi:hypothetical protein
LASVWSSLLKWKMQVLGVPVAVDQPLLATAKAVMTTYECQASSQPSFHHPAGEKIRNYSQVSDCKN